MKRGIHNKISIYFFIAESKFRKLFKRGAMAFLLFMFQTNIYFHFVGTPCP
jgi:hypothetical protein